GDLRKHAKPQRDASLCGAHVRRSGKQDQRPGQATRRWFWWQGNTIYPAQHTTRPGGEEDEAACTMHAHARRGHGHVRSETSLPGSVEGWREQGRQDPGLGP
ncbi:hypothetical protein BN1723_019322, partial [Verticillium longisporum]